MNYKNISIRRKILLSNFLMIIIPIVFVGFIFLTLLLGFTLITNNSSSFIRGVLLGTSNYGPTLLIKAMNDELASNDQITSDLEATFAQLEKLNIHLFVEKDQELMYMSPETTKQSIEQEFFDIAQTKTYTQPYIVWNQNGIAYQSSLVNANNEEVTITFSGKHLALPMGSYESWEHTKDRIKLAIVLTGTFMILFFIALGIFLTKKLSKHILKPLYELKYGTNEIMQGNLHYQIQSDAEDEIGEVCDNFDAMRMKLLASASLQKQYDQSRKELIAGISHDLSTPLTSIQGYVSGLMDGIANTPEKQQHYLSIIYDKTCNMNALVESLFLLSKLELGQEPFYDEEINLCAYLDDWKEANTQKWKDSKLILTLENTCDSPCFIRMDRTQFLRVLENICQNSIKYRQGDQAELQIALTTLEDTCTLSFQDCGIGTTQEDALKLFDSFYRGDPARSSRIKGNGLGLSITKQIIVQMGGQIHAQGEIDKGLCILIELPFKKEQTTI